MEKNMNKLKKSFPKYSVCMCNYNMGDTLERALTSVLDQLDEDYEVLVVDDGSNDDSVAKLEKLEKKYSLLRHIPLKRDRKRKLGETRNISIREARGKYVLLHIDGDDVWEPYIKDVVTLFHRIEQCLGRDFLLAGRQVNVGKKSFLLEYGPYRNVYHAEDRDLWHRLAAENAYICLDHRIFRARLPRPKQVRFLKTIKDSWAHISYDLRSGTEGMKYVSYTLMEFFKGRRKKASLKLRLLRVFLVVPAYILSKFQEPLPPPPENENFSGTFGAYRERVRGTYAEIMKRYGGDPDLSFLAAEAREIFSVRE